MKPYPDVDAAQMWAAVVPLLKELAESRRAVDAGVSYTSTARLKRVEDDLMRLYADWLTT